MSDEEITQEKQWVTLRSGSMQAYVGHGNVANVAHELRCAVGKPHGLLLASVEETDEDLVESLRRDLLAEGFTVSLTGLPSGKGSCSIASGPSTRGGRRTRIIPTGGACEQHARRTRADERSGGR